MLKQAGILAVVVFGLLFSIPFIYNASSVGLSSNASASPSLPGQDPAKKCVKDKDWMRHNHMTLIMHSREDAVRDGLRKPGHGIQGCRSCHPNRAEFCDSCHGYVGVKPECWNCHYYPEKEALALK
ncbi:MAG: cytochrome C [Nitrospinae bacterium]|nr:cytochrome C [Nitrospinota bacterium]